MKYRQKKKFCKKGEKCWKCKGERISYIEDMFWCYDCTIHFCPEGRKRDKDFKKNGPKVINIEMEDWLGKGVSHTHIPIVGNMGVQGCKGPKINYNTGPVSWGFSYATLDMPMSMDCKGHAAPVSWDFSSVTRSANEIVN